MNSLHLNIDLNFQQLLEIVKQLSPIEKVKLNEFLWNEDTEIPLKHQELVLSRIKKSKENPARLLDWDQAQKTLKQ